MEVDSLLHVLYNISCRVWREKARPNFYGGQRERRRHRRWKGRWLPLPERVEKRGCPYLSVLASSLQQGSAYTFLAGAMSKVIWFIVGAWTRGKGGCSKFIGNIPHSCMKVPTVVDLPCGTPYNMQIANYCKGGVLISYGIRIQQMH